MNKDLVRDKLTKITNQGLMLKAIALNVGIDVNDLSKFKGGMGCLKDSDVKLLSEYLNGVVIPQWNTVRKNEPMTIRERLLVSNNKQNERKRKRSNVSIDLLNELES